MYRNFYNRSILYFIHITLIEENRMKWYEDSKEIESILRKIYITRFLTPCITAVNRLAACQFSWKTIAHRCNFIDVTIGRQVDTQVDKYQLLSFGIFHNARPSQVCISIVTIRVIERAHLRC